jgi:hypothetical protein
MNVRIILLITVPALFIFGCASGNAVFRKRAKDAADNTRIAIARQRQRVSVGGEVVQQQKKVKVIRRAEDVLEFESLGEGIASKHQTQLDAEKYALEDALSEVAQVAGVNVQLGVTDVIGKRGERSYELFHEYIFLWASAQVEYSKVGSPECTVLPEGGIKCTLKIRGKAYFRGYPDADFNIEASLDKAAYFEGENVNLTVSVSKDAYITVLNVDEEGNVCLIYPNKYTKAKALKAGETLLIPGEDMPIELKTFIPRGRNESLELLHIIATKDQPLFTEKDIKEEKAEGNFIIFSLGKIEDLSRKLAQYERSRWTMKIIDYLVKKK